MTTSKMAVATLLRLADADLRDAAVLSTGRNPVNAPALVAQAVTRLVRATLVTEVGWNGDRDDGLAAVSDENPLKRDLEALAERLSSAGAPMPREDGQPQPRPDHEALNQDIGAAKAMLSDLARRFEVDLAGDNAAGNAEPLRPEPAPEIAYLPIQEQRVEDEPAASQVTPPPATSSAPTKAARKLSLRHAPVRSKASIVVGRARQSVVSPPVVGNSELEGPAAITPRPAPGTMPSSAFWSLMDRWQVADLDALQLLGHSGGLTKKGTRPRFKLAGGEVLRFLGLQEIDTALVSLDLNPSSWLHRQSKTGPFAGGTPLAFLMKSQSEGIRATLRFLLQSSLRRSVSP